jgi:thiol-disulfide isomerase/thioredoxin
MKPGWIVAGAAALALALLTLPMVREHRGERIASTSARSERGAPPEGQACDADGAKGKLDFVLKDMNNAPVRFADFKGKVVLLNFWATWCGPCKTEIPAFVQLYSEYKDKGLVIAGISIDDSPETLRPFAKEWKMQYPILLMQSDIEDAYGPFYGVPTSYLLARDGTICTKHIGPASKEAFEHEIRALL